MSEKKIDVNVSGKGKASIGNIVQGNMELHGGQHVDSVPIETVEHLIQHLESYAKQAGMGPEAAGAVIKDLKGVESEARTPEKRAGLLKGMLSIIKEHHAWAFPLLSSLGPKLIELVSRIPLPG